MQDFKYKIFFDESKIDSLRADLEIGLMGCLSVPVLLYDRPNIKEINKKLQERKIKFHFTDYQKKDYSNYSEILSNLFGTNGENAQYVKFNFIAYSSKNYQNNIAYNKTNLSNMIYSKIPERVIYGVLRKISKYRPTSAEIYVEESTEYKQKNLDQLLKERLNVQALYRNDNFFVNKSGLYPKNKEIGIEITDTLLGIISVVMRNEQAVDLLSRKITSKKLWGKKNFIYRNQLIIKKIINNLNYYEMDGSSTLTKRDFLPFFNEFILQYEDELRRKK